MHLGQFAWYDLLYAIIILTNKNDRPRPILKIWSLHTCLLHGHTSHKITTHPNKNVKEYLPVQQSFFENSLAFPTEQN